MSDSTYSEFPVPEEWTEEHSDRSVPGDRFGFWKLIIEFFVLKFHFLLVSILMVPIRLDHVNAKKAVPFIFSPRSRLECEEKTD